MESHSLTLGSTSYPGTLADPFPGLSWSKGTGRPLGSRLRPTPIHLECWISPSFPLVGQSDRVPRSAFAARPGLLDARLHRTKPPWILTRHRVV